MPRIDVDIKNEDQFRRAMRKAPGLAEDKLKQAVRGGIAVIAKNTQKDDPIPFDTGRLLNSFEPPIISGLTGRWGPRVDYARFVHEGTRPHTIRAKNAEVLANPKTGQIFGKEVQHPGTSPNPFMNELVRKTEDDVNQVFNEAAQSLVQEVARRAS